MYDKNYYKKHEDGSLQSAIRIISYIETIAKDGIAVIVNNANTCDDLTLDQVKSIYTGETTVWSDIIK